MCMVKNTENSVSDNISSRNLLRLFNEFQMNWHRRLLLNNLMKLEGENKTNHWKVTLNHAKPHETKQNHLELSGIMRHAFLIIKPVKRKKRHKQKNIKKYTIGLRDRQSLPVA